MYQNNSKNNQLQKLVEVVSVLRGPHGCPWDKEQNHKTLKKYLLNESYELLDAIDSDDYKAICEELGDVLLQVILHAQIASENNQFTIEDVSRTITEKLIRRHPHVFSDTKVNNSDEVVVNWENLKNQEKPERTSALDGIPEAAPQLMRSDMISKKAVAVGFEWPDVNMLWDTFYSEIDEFKQAVGSKDNSRMSDELGDIFFTLVNIARWYKINPELALKDTNKKFISRFKLMEKNASQNLSEYSQPELEELWQDSKKIIK